VIAVAQGRGDLAPGFEQGAQEPLALDQRHLAQVVTFDIRQVEKVENQAARLRPRHHVLQGLEIGRSVRHEHHGFAVQDCFLRREAAGGLGNAREPLRPVLAVPGDQAGRLTGPQVAQQAVAVELDLVQPISAGRNFVNQGGHLRAQFLRRVARPGAG
jgi:hypothetical protein